MPRTDIDYSKAVIYKLVSKDLETKECYVGSTTSFSKRKHKHKSNCRNEKTKYHDLYVYQFIRDHGGWESWDMVLVENYPCETKLELESRERYWIEKLNAKLNQIVPVRNKKDQAESSKKWYAGHKDEKRLKNEEYRKKNKEILNEKRKQLTRCVCGVLHTHGHDHVHKKSRRHQKFISRYEIVPEE